MLVSIAIATFHRPDGLRRLLEGIDHQDFGHEIEIVVVDNDSQASARAVAQEMAAAMKWPLKYIVEPEQGISHARNRGVAERSANASFVAFIDDDEVPNQDWLSQLVAAQEANDADVVHGRVIPFYMEGVPSWVVDGQFFVQPAFLEDSSGSNRLNTAATNCTLVRASVFDDHNPPFDSQFALTGGEDDFLFRTLHAEGQTLVYEPQAIVTEWIPAHRANARWLIKSAYRKGNTYTLIHLRIQPTMAQRLSRATKGLGRIGQGLLEAGAHVLKRDKLWVLGAQKVALGLGTLVGVSGKSLYRAYAKPRGL